MMKALDVKLITERIMAHKLLTTNKSSTILGTSTVFSHLYALLGVCDTSSKNPLAMFDDVFHR
jgi:hypothetical protein